MVKSRANDRTTWRSGRLVPIIRVLVLAAALAVGLELAGVWLRNSVDRTWPSPDVFRWCHAIAATIFPVTVALVPLRFSRPRPPLRRIVRQPGFQASVAACVGLLWHAKLIAYYLSHPWADASDRYFFFVGIGLPEAIGPAVATAWIGLALSGGWRSERSWVDRLGRLLGAVWIASYFAVFIYGIYSYLK